ncbi:hypothetical protein [Methylicorpusculum sp.]|uniref:hypothetical protein n=1 Tax=Methylicorpusculum sp. TaxID=2713644 RepID=UPI00271577D5|nr:hypothetical protein [Methylicorpusculum sp.]MDO8843617.1 hypothetical protein [Methylicorpusculum sp.]
MQAQHNERLICIESFNQRSALFFLVLLLSADIIFVVLHCLNIVVPGLKVPLLSLETDQSYAEFYQYIKWLWIIITLVFISSKMASKQYLAWVVVFAYFLLDDALQVHERAGDIIAGKLDFMPRLGLQQQDLGELAVSVMAAAILIIPLSWAYMTGSRAFRKVSEDIALLILVLIFFGVAIDMVHSAINLGTVIGLLIGLIEDGGEMITVSLILWYVFLMLVRESEPDRYLCDCLRKWKAQ